MDQDLQFKLMLAVNTAIAVGTIGAVVVALFGDWLRAQMFRPSLDIRLVSALGEPTVIRTESGPAAERRARYYHARVTNQRSWPKATQVQVWLVRLDEPGPDGILQTIWSGEVPFKWKFHEIHPLQRTVGPDADCDLVSVIKGVGVQLHPLIVPNNLASFVLRSAKTDFVLNLQARAAERVSDIRAFRVSWDGIWEDGEAEMSRHLVVRELRPPTAVDIGAP